MAVEGKIAASAQGEMPLTWKALAKAESGYGEGFITTRVELIKTRLFGQVIVSAVEDALDRRVIDYAGKLVALELINAGVDYWGKQPLTIGATGRNENKGYKDRSADLLRLRENLLMQTRLLFPDIAVLLPGRQVNTVASHPRVRDIAAAKAHTPNPYDFEPPFAPGT